MLYITGRHEASGTQLQGSLNLVDLAGEGRPRSMPAHHAYQPVCSAWSQSVASIGLKLG